MSSPPRRSRPPTPEALAMPLAKESGVEEDRDL